MSTREPAFSAGETLPATQHQGGSICTVCLYQASDPEALREHARRVGMPADAISRVIDTVIVRPDPTIA